VYSFPCVPPTTTTFRIVDMLPDSEAATTGKDNVKQIKESMLLSDSISKLYLCKNDCMLFPINRYFSFTVNVSKVY
jgi:hypothetical protein